MKVRKGSCLVAVIRFDRYEQAKRAAERLWSQKRFGFTGATRLAPDGQKVALRIESERPIRVALLERLGGALAVLDGADDGRGGTDGDAGDGGDQASGPRVAGRSG